MGAKKKKGLASRLAKMSDEERARYMQHSADIEEENRRRKEQLIVAFLKNKLKKEDGFSRLNVAKINQNWHQIMRKIRCKGMKEDVEFLKSHIEGMLELRNRMINNLLMELEEAEEQYTNNFQTHLTHINNIIEFGQTSLDELHHEYDSERANLLQIAAKDRQQSLEKAYNDITHLKSIIYSQGETGRKKIRENYEYYFQRSDDVIRENKRELDEMRRAKESMLGNLWRQISSVLRTYVENTDKRRAHLAELQSLDAESAAEIAQNEETIRRQEDQILLMEKQYETMQRICNEENRVLSETIKGYKKISLHTKNRLKKDLEADEKRLITLTEISNDVINWLQIVNTKGERLLQLAQVCRRLETQKEKVLRFNNEFEINDAVITDETDEVTNEPVEVTTEPLDGNQKSIDKAQSDSSESTSIFNNENKSGVMQDCFEAVRNLDGLWITYNRVRLSCKEMKEEKRVLEEQNVKLKIALRIALESAALNSISSQYKDTASDIYVDSSIYAN